MAPSDDSNETETRRSRRARGPNSRAKEALAKLKHHRETGEKISYEVDEQSNIYDVVDEEEYSRIVTKRREEEDWIVDDDGSGYVDDGREIFDDDLEAEPSANGAKRRKAKKSETGSGTANGKGKISRISNLFVAKSKKKKEEDASVKEDDVLHDILKNLKSPTSDKKMSPIEQYKTPKRSKLEHKRPRKLEGVSAERPKAPFSVKHDQRLAPLKDRTRHPPQQREIVDDRALDEGIRESFLDSPQKDNNEYIPGESKGNVESPTKLANNLVDDGLDFDDDSCDFDINKIDDKKKSRVEEAVVSEELITECKPEFQQNNDVQGLWNIKTEQQAPSNIQVDSSKLPLCEAEGVKFFKFFWLDAYEDRLKQPGVVFLFGKVWVESAKSYVSCCCMVKNIDRVLFLLPRNKILDTEGNETDKDVKLEDVYKEFNEISNRYKIMNFKCKEAEKLYAFEKDDVPKQSKYLEIRYSAEYQSLPSNLSGKTFSLVFGCNTSSLETLLMEQKLKGPSWLRVDNPGIPSSSVSWCKIEVVVENKSYISVIDDNSTPPLTVLSLRLLTLPIQNGQSHEVLGIAGLVHNEVHLDKGSPQIPCNYNFCFVCKPSEHLLPYDFQTVLKREAKSIQITSSERSMLGLFLARLQMIDPDVIIGHDVCGFDFDVLLHRINATKVPHWSKLGRLKRQIMPKLSNTSHGGNFSFQGDRTVACGRLVLDVKTSAQELIRSRSYDLSELSSVVLGKKREERNPEGKEKMLSSSSNLLQLLNSTMLDALLNLKITYELNVIPLAYQITGICGNVMSRTLQGGRSERNEFLLLHAFCERNYICPDKNFPTKKQEISADDEKDEGRGKGRTGRKKPAYSGGLVLEPKKGFYDRYVLLLDFNSLYPSIIQEFNICFTTISRGKEDDDSIPPIPDSSLEFGVLPTEIKKLVERRRQVKGIMKGLKSNSEQYIQYDIRQKALKLTANSMYGCLGFSHSRFFAKPLAALVTSKGREILMKTKDLAETLGLDVIYGDTDSIMINTNSSDLNEVQRIGNKVKAEVNKLYKLLEIDIDGIYKSMLLLKKKKYAAVSVQRLENGTIIEHKEMKGLDIVRRDWCDLAKEAGEYVIGQILSCQARETMIDNIHDYLMTIKERVEEGRVDMEKFEIRKALAKAPEDYPDGKAQPHVTVAQRLMSQGRRVAVGDTISYVICNDGSTLPASQRAYHPDECLKNASLKIDNKYYLASQIHPVVSRLCDPIEGTNAAAIAECLGLDSSQYKSTSSSETHEADASLGFATLMSHEERFQDVDKFYVICSNKSCALSKSEICVESASKANWKCTSCQTTYNFTQLYNNVSLMMRRHIKQYYQGYLTCDDSSCACRTRLMRLRRSSAQQLCAHCGKGHLRPLYSEGRLYNQLLYLKTVFHDARPQGQEGPAHTLQQKLKTVLDKSGYSAIDLGQIFQF